MENIVNIDTHQMYQFQYDFCLNCPLQISLLLAVNIFHKEGFLKLLCFKCENAIRVLQFNLRYRNCVDGEVSKHEIQKGTLKTKS